MNDNYDDCMHGKLILYMHASPFEEVAVQVDDWKEQSAVSACMYNSIHAHLS